MCRAADAPAPLLPPRATATRNSAAHSAAHAAGGDGLRGGADDVAAAGGGGAGGRLARPPTGWSAAAWARPGRRRTVCDAGGRCTLVPVRCDAVTLPPSAARYCHPLPPFPPLSSPERCAAPVSARASDLLRSQGEKTEPPSAALPPPPPSAPLPTATLPDRQFPHSTAGTRAWRWPQLHYRLHHVCSCNHTSEQVEVACSLHINFVEQEKTGQMSRSCVFPRRSKLV